MNIPRRTYFATQTLPGGGGFLTGPLFDLPIGTKSLTFYVTYDPPNIGVSQPKFELEFGNAAETGAVGEVARDVLVNGSSFVDNDPDGEITILESVIFGPHLTAAGTFLIRCSCVPGGATQFRFSAAEAGDIAAPGDITVTFTGA